MAKLLIVEDSEPLRLLLADELAVEGYEVEAVADGGSALEAWRRGGHELLLLDVMLPSLPGTEVCAAIRAADGPQPIVLMLTARTSEEDAVVGFAAGADDYVRKPFGLQELKARLAALLRRRERGAEPPHVASPRGVVTLGALRLDEGARRAEVGGRTVRLTPKELDLLLFLAARPGLAIRREDLLREVWGYSHTGYARTVDSHVLRVRRKLSAAGLEPVPISTVHGSGYRWGPGP